MWNGYEITTRLAESVQRAAQFLCRPGLCGQRGQSADVHGQDVIVEGLEKLRGCDAVALAAGDLQSSLLVRDALPRDVDLSELVRLGGVGDIIGHILDAGGRLIDHDIKPAGWWA